jgi:hypothetical protein
MIDSARNNDDDDASQLPILKAVLGWEVAKLRVTSVFLTEEPSVSSIGNRTPSNFLITERSLREAGAGLQAITTKVGGGGGLDFLLLQASITVKMRVCVLLHFDSDTNSCLLGRAYGARKH